MDEAQKLLNEAMSQAKSAKSSGGSARIASFQQAMQLSQRVLDFALPTDAVYVPLLD